LSHIAPVSPSLGEIDTKLKFIWKYFEF
jgi:hypothetical protein